MGKHKNTNKWLLGYATDMHFVCKQAENTGMMDMDLLCSPFLPVVNPE